MNNQSDALSQRLQLITKNGFLLLAIVEEHRPLPPTTDNIQLELDFNQETIDYH